MGGDGRSRLALVLGKLSNEGKDLGNVGRRSRTDSQHAATILAAATASPDIRRAASFPRFSLTAPVQLNQRGNIRIELRFRVNEPQWHL
jgi:hypothetical protein